MVASLCSGSSSSLQNYFEGWNNRSYRRCGRELLGLEFIVKDGEGGCHGLEGVPARFIVLTIHLYCDRIWELGAHFASHQAHVEGNSPGNPSQKLEAQA